MIVAGLIAIAAMTMPATERKVPTPPHVGNYTPNSQLLAWCKAKDANGVLQCRSFITGVADAAGNTATTWPKGWIEVPVEALSVKFVKVVVAALEKVSPEEMSAPASETVYEALVTAYPYRAATIELD